MGSPLCSSLRTWSHCWPIWLYCQVTYSSCGTSMCTVTSRTRSGLKTFLVTWLGYVRYWMPNSQTRLTMLQAECRQPAVTLDSLVIGDHTQGAQKADQIYQINPVHWTLAPTLFIKEPGVWECLLLLVLTVINTSLSSGVVPPCPKQAVITPILKKSRLDNTTEKLSTGVQHPISGEGHGEGCCCPTDKTSGEIEHAWLTAICIQMWFQNRDCPPENQRQHWLRSRSRSRHAACPFGIVSCFGHSDSWYPLRQTWAHCWQWVAYKELLWIG